MSDTNEQSANETGNARPVASFCGSEGIPIAIWRNKSETTRTCTRSSSIVDTKTRKDGEYKSTQYLRASDLLRAQTLLEQADYWIEADKQKNRVAAQSQTTR